VLPTSRVILESRSAPGQFFGSYVVNRVFTTCLVQWLGWVFATQERKKENVHIHVYICTCMYTCIHVYIYIYTYINIYIYVHIYIYIYIYIYTYAASLCGKIYLFVLLKLWSMLRQDHSTDSSHCIGLNLQTHIVWVWSATFQKEICNSCCWFRSGKGPTTQIPLRFLRVLGQTLES